MAAMERCHNCGKPVLEVKASVDGSDTRWFHVIPSDKKVVTNQLCNPSKPASQCNVASPPTITDAEARMHLDELDELTKGF